MTMDRETDRVKVDIFSMTREEAEQFKQDREHFMLVVRKLMYEFCPIVTLERFEENEGERISGYLTEETQWERTPVLSIVLDPFEVSAMKVAEERGKLKEYVFAASEMTEPLLQVLKKELGVEK